ncbi:hypothetical protein NIES39_A07180 [Arthrospira platensis NIES-39]|nr:hypothetical protein NIES39_A07180 [Arthrospira platensis NIES-39]
MWVGGYTGNRQQPKNNDRLWAVLACSNTTGYLTGVDRVAIASLESQYAQPTFAGN